MGKGRYLGDAFHFSGILKIIEIVFLFITIIIHRYGDNGTYLFFATAGEQIQYVSDILQNITILTKTHLDL